MASQHRSAKTSPPPSTGLRAAFSPQTVTRRSSIRSPPTWRAHRETPRLVRLDTRSNRHPPLIAALKQIEAPLVAINPDVSPTDIESLQAHGVETTIVAGVGHFLMLEDPDQFNPVLISALKAFGGFQS